MYKDKKSKKKKKNLKKRKKKKKLIKWGVTLMCTHKHTDTHYVHTLFFILLHTHNPKQKKNY